MARFDPHDPHREQPRKPSRRAVALRLNALAQVLDTAFEHLSELRHELGVEARIEDKARELSRRSTFGVDVDSIE